MKEHMLSSFIQPSFTNEVIKYTAPVGLFWLSLNIFQIGFGKLKYYSGRKGIVWCAFI
jgi:hypothetical protein